ncbi:MAG: hypothetical protein ACRC92_19125 [Peptostreptococcaceae bacterium]
MFKDAFNFEIKTNYESFCVYGIKNERVSFTCFFDNELSVITSGSIGYNMFKNTRGLTYIKNIIFEEMEDKYNSINNKGKNMDYATLQESKEAVELAFILLEIMDIV